MLGSQQSESKPGHKKTGPDRKNRFRKLSLCSEQVVADSSLPAAKVQVPPAPGRRSPGGVLKIRRFPTGDFRVLVRVEFDEADFATFAEGQYVAVNLEQGIPKCPAFAPHDLAGFQFDAPQVGVLRV